MGCVLGYRDALHATPGEFNSHTVHNLSWVPGTQSTPNALSRVQLLDRMQCKIHIKGNYVMQLGLGLKESFAGTIANHV